MSDKIGILGLGYVGLPLAVEFAKKYETIGFDINQGRVDELVRGHDQTLEVSDEDLQNVLVKEEGELGLYCTTDLQSLESCNILIVTVPTPIDEHFNPDLTPLIRASESVGKVLKKGDIVIYESTVYPGATEEDCVPVLEKTSGLKFNVDFYCGYSPERINPGDKEHTVSKILKVTSGSTPESADKIDALYKSVITAGTFKAASIKVAEAAKVIENSQRDINIAFVNELAIIFNKLGIDTQEVLDAAGTKWNFLPFKPGLVGGHCIGVDPYYLAQKAQKMGYYPQMILAGRRLNNGMGTYIGKQFIKLLIHKNLPIRGAKALVLGVTFKENCPDIRNSKVPTIIEELEDYNLDVDVFDPWASPEEVKHEFGYELLKEEDIDFSKYSGIILAVSHKEFEGFIPEAVFENNTVFDVKSFLPKDKVTARL
jgi:UDP-N-acetyl-D-galactosamine dehydrogenase